MIPVVTPAEMNAIDAAASVPTAELVERAGAAVATAAIGLLGGRYGRRVAVICGPGNNGADGRVAARRLRAAGVGVDVIDALDQPRAVSGVDLVIDAAFGTGLRDSYVPPRCGGIPVLSVDIPSGVSGLDGSVVDEAFTADVTVTFAALKPGLLLGEGPSRSGRVVVADIGLDVSGATAHLVEEGDAASWWPRPDRSAHKWSRAVWVIGGSAGMHGAPGLVVRGAQGCGAGYVRVSVPGDDPDAVSAAPIEAVRVAVDPADLSADVAATGHRFGALVVGPGLGEFGADHVVADLVSSAAPPMVVDGDALATGWGERALDAHAGPRVYTPHDREFESGRGSAPGDDRVAAARSAAASVGGVVLLKGPTTVVAAPGGEVLVVDSGDVRLATAGTGDVLSGAIGALLAAGLDPLRAAALGAFVHGRAAADCPVVGTTASMVADALAPTVSDMVDPAPRARARVTMFRPTWAVVDTGVIADNAAELVRACGGAALCAVVKADGYGHGAVRVARAALDGGATWLAVALVEEAIELRDAGIVAPILLLSQPPPGSMAAALRADVSLCVDSAQGVDAVAAHAGNDLVAKVHLKVNTGMNRVGCAPDDAVNLARRLVSLPGVRLEGVWTHLSVADEPDNPETRSQLDRFHRVVGALESEGIQPGIRHVSNSAGLLFHPDARLDMVRCGIALYGIEPAPGLAVPTGAAMSLVSAVSHINRLTVGDAVSYGRRWTAAAPTTIATVPIGYADGIRRDAHRRGAQVLIGGQARSIVGTVTMDQLMVDVGDDVVSVGDQVVLIGSQGSERITADDWAVWLDTIGYEVVCDVGRRVPRVDAPLEPLL